MKYMLIFAALILLVGCEPHNDELVSTPSSPTSINFTIGELEDIREVLDTLDRQRNNIEALLNSKEPDG